MQVNITIQGDKDFIAKLNRIGSSITDLTGGLSDLGKQMVNYYSTRPFFSRGQVYGETWQALSPAREAYKIKHRDEMMAGVSPAQPLIFTGKMMKSFTFESGASFLRVYNTVDYFAKHQLGEGVPQRIMLALNSELINTIRTSIKNDIEKKINSIL